VTYLFEHLTNKERKKSIIS